MKYFDEEVFEHQNFTDNPLEKGEYEFCTFVNCDFSNSTLADVKFIDSEFVDCNLSNAVLNNTFFQQVGFEKCKLLGLQFEHCSNFGFAIVANQCQLNHASFYQVNLAKSQFISCQMEGVDFTEAMMKSTVMTECDLKHAVFDTTNLEGADLRKSTAYSIDPESNRIKGAKFSLPDAKGLLDKYSIVIEDV